MTEKNLLTEGRVLPVLMRFTVPFLIANIIQALYGAVDLAVIELASAIPRAWPRYRPARR